MAECTNEPNCFINKGEYEANPIFLGDPMDGYCSDIIKPEDCTTNQLTKWKLEDYNHETTYDANLNKLYENENSQNESLKNDRCVCIDAWEKLKQVFELTDEQLSATVPLKNTFPGDMFYHMPIDFNDDDCGENLVNFQLNGEYLYKSNGTTQIDDLNKANNLIVDKKTTIANVKEKEVVINEPKVQTAIVKTTATIINSSGNDQKKNKSILQNTNHTTTTTNGTTKDNKENKKIDFDNTQTDKSGEKTNNKRKIKKQNVKKTVKGKRINKKCCIPAESAIKNEESGYNLKYIYTYGEEYRGGIQKGHKNCVDFWVPIPRSKGWISESYINTQRKITSEQKLLKFELGRMQEGDTQRNAMAEEKATKKQEKQLTKPRVTNQSVNNLVSDGETKKVIKDNTENKDTAVPALKLNKTNGVYTIKMNRLANDGRLDTVEEPVVFRLGTQVNTEFHSSCSSFDLKFAPPAALCPKKTRRDVYTSYDQELFKPTGRKKGEKNTA